MLDSRSVKASETVGKDSRGHDRGKRLPESSEAMINLAAIRLRTRRLTRPTVHPALPRPWPGNPVTAA
ncbi:hypothetical protein ACH427_27995 [Streptomyces sp. NPDC020379]|uniref:hypothetical protein n=1 Tax=Streptomyces sp. NPDC020379 TaxID=3365071 RepID=UPI003792CB68